MADYYIGLMSGTSVDGIDAALVRFGESAVDIERTRTHGYPAELHRDLIRAIREPARCTVDDFGSLDRRVGAAFRDAATELMRSAGVDAADVAAIGSHGQTIRHRPNADDPFTLQIGDPSVIAKGTGITTVADFRRADLALGGQGAPLTPLFHDWLFREAGKTVVVLNIGGMANITVLPGDGGDVIGFDTGPGNTLIDAWIREHRGEAFDRAGQWAASGSIEPELLSRLLAVPYFAAPPPKSSGFEHFNLDWVRAAGIEGYDPEAVQATLCALTAHSIAAAIREHAPGAAELVACGGGVHNDALMAGLADGLPGVSITTTASRGLDPDWVEAAAFAWLAKRTLRGLAGNLPSVTGASRATVLGAVYSAR